MQEGALSIQSHIALGTLDIRGLKNHSKMSVQEVRKSINDIFSFRHLFIFYNDIVEHTQSVQFV